MDERAARASRGVVTPIQLLDEGILAHIFSFLKPMPDRFNASRVCGRWRTIASDPCMWLHVDSVRSLSAVPGVFITVQDAVTAARPGDTIILSPGEHVACNIQIDKPLCLIGAGDTADDTLLYCPRGFESAFIFSENGRLSNLTVKAELGTCLLHKKGRLTVEGCALKCGEHPLEHLSFPIVSIADALPCPLTKRCSGVSVVETQIQGGAKAVKTSGSLVLQQVRVMYARAALTFWFNVSQKRLKDVPDASLVACKA